MYEVYLSDGIDIARLNTEDIDIATTFSIADVVDIAKRTDNITKQINFKGTRNNNSVFGSLFHLNRVADFNISNKLYFNYSSLRTVDCFVYEESLLILRGSLRVLGCQVDDFGNITYQTVITGSFIDFKLIVSEKKLTDLDFSSLQHRYNWSNISNSWNTSIETADVINEITASVSFQNAGGYYIGFLNQNSLFNYFSVGDEVTISGTPYNDRTYHITLVQLIDSTHFFLQVTEPVSTSFPFTVTISFSKPYINFQTTPFEKGNGYVYPFIDYGNIFKDSSANIDLNKINLSNFRPAIFVKEYFKKIFSQSELNGYSYEIKGSTSLQEIFNSLIIPNNLEKVINKSQNLNTKVYNYSAINNDHTYEYLGFTYFSRALPITGGFSSTLSKNLFNPYGTYRNDASALFVAARTFTSDGYAKVFINSIHNKYTDHKTVHIQLCKREFIDSSNSDFHSADNWSVVSQSTFGINASSTLTNVLVEFEIGETTFNYGEQLVLRMFIDEGTLANFFDLIEYTITTVELQFPKQNSLSLSYEISDGDMFQPVPVDGIKQIDFIKHIINLFNFYVYSTKDRPKHLIFQNYNDYYVFASPIYLKNNSLDWTKKLHHKCFKITPNISIPKNYQFTLKDDSDYYNALYKKTHSEIFGTYTFEDKYGVTSEKKIELIFSPSPLVEYLGTGRLHPVICAIDNGTKKPVKSNIRIAYYNGLKDCKPYTVSKDVFTGSGYSTSDIATGLTNYPQAGNYYFASGTSNLTPINDLYFGVPKELYFVATTGYRTTPTAYSQYYLGQTSELTNPNVMFLEADFYLNETDINNLDLRTPIFLDLGNKGHGYFKLLSVEYINSTSVARVQLQKIFVGS